MEKLPFGLRALVLFAQCWVLYNFAYPPVIQGQSSFVFGPMVAPVDTGRLIAMQGIIVMITWLICTFFLWVERSNVVSNYMDER